MRRRPAIAARAALSLWLAFLAGCGATLRAGRPSAVPDDALEIEERATERCVHGSIGPDSPYRDELPGPVTDPELAAHLEPFDADVRRTAVAAGLEPLLGRLLREQDRVRSGAGSTDALYAMRDELSARMFALESQLLAMEFEVDCVRGLVDDALGEYAAAETDRQLALTIASLVVGAGTGVASAVWDVANNAVAEPAWGDGPLWTAIVGAAATTALGVAVLVPPPREVFYVHGRNVLWPVVVGEDEELVFPTFVFRLLVTPRAGGAPAPRDELLSAFEARFEEVVAPDERDLARELLFGEGGAYDVRLVELHDDLLAELGATLDALARDIDALGSAIAFVLRDRAYDEEAAEPGARAEELAGDGARDPAGDGARDPARPAAGDGARDPAAPAASDGARDPAAPAAGDRARDPAAPAEGDGVAAPAGAP